MIELQLLAPEDLVEMASDALMDELGALSVSVEDADADTGAEKALLADVTSKNADATATELLRLATLLQQLVRPGVC